MPQRNLEIPRLHIWQKIIVLPAHWFLLKQVYFYGQIYEILGNSVHGLNPHQKHLLYRSCTLPIVLYGFQLWHYNNAPLSYSLKMLGKIQRRAAIWILDTFKIFLSFGVKAIIGLIPINLHLQKLSRRSQLRVYSLLSNYILCSFMKPRENSSHNQHSLSLGGLTRYQCNLIKGLLVDMDNWFNEIFLSFTPLHPEFSPGSRVIDLFSNCFSFHPVSKYNNSYKVWIQRLDNLTIELSRALLHTLVITDANIKNNTVTSISHIHIHNKPVIKILYHTTNIMSTEAKLFVIRCGINQATISDNISNIIVITDSIHAAKKIFDPLSHPFQCHITSILNELWNFFSCNQENLIKFWECPSHCK